MLRRALTVLPLVVFVALAGYLAAGLRPGRDPAALPSALIDREAPAFALPDLAGGESVASTGLGGQVVLINYFASWCVPCRIEHPLLMRLKEREHVTIWGIAYKDKPEELQKLLAQLGDPYARVGVDRTGQAGFDFGVYGVPETFVIDRAGHIRQRFVGPLTPENVERDLLPLLQALEKSGGEIVKLALVALLLLLAAPLGAVEPNERLADPALEARARAISQGLRCLVCQNESIDESNADLAHDIRVRLRERLAAGDSDAGAVAFIVARYGEFVLLDPPVKPATWLLWFGPPLLLAAATGAVVMVARRRRSLPPATPLSADERERLAALLDRDP